MIKINGLKNNENVVEIENINIQKLGNVFYLPLFDRKALPLSLLLNQ